MILTNLTDSELIQNIKNKRCEDSFLELKKRHEKIVFNVCAGYTRKTKIIKYEEIIENVDFILNDALNTFEENEGCKFSTWLFNRSRYFILKSLKEINKYNKCIQCENKEIDFINNKNNKVYNLDNSEIKKKDIKEHIFHIIKSLDDDRLKTIFEMRYYGDKKTKKWKTIAENLQLSVTYTKLLHDKTCKILKKHTEL